MKINKIIKYVALMAPIVEGYAVGISIDKELHWHFPVVLISSGVLALTGFWGVQVWNQMSEYNTRIFRDRLLGEQRKLLTAPTQKVGIVLLIWFTGVILLTVFLKTSPILRDWAPPVIVLIGACSAYLLSLSNEQEAREEAADKHRVARVKEKEIADNKKKEESNLRKQNEQALATIRQKINASVQGTAVKTRAKSGTKLSDAALLFEWAKNPYLTDTQMVVLFGKPVKDGGHDIEVSRQAVAQRRLKMIEKGLIVQNKDGRIVQYLDVGTDGGGEG